MTNLAVFASGNGTNAENLIQHFEFHPEINVRVVVSNRKDAFVLQRAERLGVEAKRLGSKALNAPDQLLPFLQERTIDYIILAGYMRLIPPFLVREYPKRIINIHPSLLPSYGGKGMYGDRVHRAVLANGENRTGITIHYVNEVYDDGEIIYQAECPVQENDTPDTLAERVHELEYKYFPAIVEQVLGG